MMSHHEATGYTPEIDGDLWHVQLASGDVCLMTLDQLDDAFQTSVINENTYLWQEGATGWVTLREVAGLDSEEEVVQQVAVDKSFQQANPFVQPEHASNSVWPPVPAAPRYDYAAQDIYAPPLQTIGPHSTAPVMSAVRDMEFDLEPIDFRRKKRSGTRWFFAAALIGGAGFGAVKYKLVPIPQLSAPTVTAVAASPVPPADIAATPTSPSSPSPVAASPNPAPTADPAKGKVLPDDVKQRLANADKALAEKQKQKQQLLQLRHSAAPRSSRSRTSGGEKVFHKGGDTGDPLDSAL